MTDMVLKTFWHHSPASFSFSGCGTNLAPIGCAFRLFQNDLNRYKFVSEQVNTTDSGILVFIDRFPSFSTLSWDYTAFELRKLLSNWSSSHCVLSKTAIKNSESSCATFPQFKAKFDARMLFYQGCHFLGIPKSQMESHTHCYLKDNTQQSQELQSQSSKQEMAQWALSATSATSLG